ncbi:hypothetical protein J6590_027408 [Homalodisca vitripennis]|nr:hypothetical protein J6590_027408 [Homalodisca vitripennis]
MWVFSVLQFGTTCPTVRGSLPALLQKAGRISSQAEEGADSNCAALVQSTLQDPETAFGGYPAKLKKVLIVTAPLWFKAPFKILRLFVREKLRDRVYTVSVPQLSSHVPRQALPTWLGGTVAVTHHVWLLHCLKSMANVQQRNGLTDGDTQLGECGDVKAGASPAASEEDEEELEITARTNNTAEIWQRGANDSGTRKWMVSLVFFC